jgi:hypothetical protein
MKHPEQDLQRAVARYLDAVLPKDVLWSCIPSGGGGAIRGKQLKAMGLKRGLGDIYIAWNETHGDAFSQETCWLELKSKQGRQSDEQCAFEVAAQKIGHSYFICRSVDTVRDALKSACVPTRETKR